MISDGSRGGGVGWYSSLLTVDLDSLLILAESDGEGPPSDAMRLMSLPTMCCFWKYVHKRFTEA